MPIGDVCGSQLDPSSEADSTKGRAFTSSQDSEFFSGYMTHLLESMDDQHSYTKFFLVGKSEHCNGDLSGAC